MSTNNICFYGEIRIIFTWYHLLSGAMTYLAMKTSVDFYTKRTVVRRCDICSHEEI